MKRLLALIPAVLLLASCNGDPLVSDYDTSIILPGNVINTFFTSTIIGHAIAAKCENGNMLYNLSDVGFKPLSKQHE